MIQPFLHPAPALSPGERREKGRFLAGRPHFTPLPYSGLKENLGYLSTLKVKGIVLGPIHKNQKDDVNGTDLEQIDPIFGTKEDFYSLLQSAKKKSRCPGVGEEGLGLLARGKAGEDYCLVYCGSGFS